MSTNARKHPLDSAARWLAWLGLLSSGVVSSFGCSPTDGAVEQGAVLRTSRCGRGMAVVMTDYASTEVGVLHADGGVATNTLISSASTSVGLSAPLSGDVVLPSTRMTGEVVLVDRYPASVLTAVSPADAVVKAQLNVSTGFAANPHDYLPLPDGRALVARYESNGAAGVEPFDGGGDLLVVDLKAGSIVDRIDLATATSAHPDVIPRATRLLRVGSQIWVLLGALSQDFAIAAPSVVAVLDGSSLELQGMVELPESRNCVHFASGPNYDMQGNARTDVVVAIACPGRFRLPASGFTENDSTVAILEASDSGLPTLRETWTTARIDPQGAFPRRGFGDALAVDGAEAVLVSVAQDVEVGVDDAPDELWRIPLDGGAPSLVFATGVTAFALGDVRCQHPIVAATASTGALGCGLCFAADAAASDVKVIASGVVVGSVSLGRSGLPPRFLGRL